LEDDLAMQASNYESEDKHMRLQAERKSILL